MIKKFTIPGLNQEELQSRLSDTRYPNELQEDSGWKYGSPTWAVKDMIDYWKTSFSWEKSREEMNRWNHYQTSINDLNIHFIHETSAQESSIPIILLHGWPSTFYEFHKIIEPLRDNPTQSFHVVVPSLPGFGFSEAPKKSGCGINFFADVTHQLMLKLGYNKYMIYGTDWGTSVGTIMSQKNPSHVIGFLTTMIVVPPPMPTLKNIVCHPIRVILFILSLIIGLGKVYGEDYAHLANFSLANVEKSEDAAYRAIQCARPYTLAYGLSDSPVGLLGWMLEPYHVWTFHEADLDNNSIPETITTDEFLTQVSIYWITNTMSSSIRIYYEGFREMKQNNSYSIKVPLAVTYFKNEIGKFPLDWVKSNYGDNLIQFRTHPKGGHFPALEQTELLLDDIQQFSIAISNKAQTKKNI